MNVRKHTLSIDDSGVARAFGGAFDDFMVRMSFEALLSKYISVLNALKRGRPWNVYVQEYFMRLPCFILSSASWLEAYKYRR